MKPFQISCQSKGYWSFSPLLSAGCYRWVLDVCVRTTNGSSPVQVVAELNDQLLSPVEPTIQLVAGSQGTLGTPELDIHIPDHVLLSVGADQKIDHLSKLLQLCADVVEELVELPIHFQAILDDLVGGGQCVALEEVLRAEKVVDEQNGAQLGFHVLPGTFVAESTDGGLLKVLAFLGRRVCLRCSEQGLRDVGMDVIDVISDLLQFNLMVPKNLFLRFLLLLLD